MEEIQKKEIFYIRHAEPDKNIIEGRSSCDINLSEKGIVQAKLLAERLEGRHFDRIITSPLIRCVRTASAVAEKLDNPPMIEIMPELIENSTLPGYECPDIEYFGKHFGNIEFCRDKVYEFVTGSNKEDFINQERAEAIAEYLKNETEYGEKILVFCHGSFGNFYIPAAVGMRQGDFILSLSHASVSKIKYTSDGKQRISFLNDISHLRPIMQNYEFDT